jgi:hypothetical protein
LQLNIFDRQPEPSMGFEPMTPFLPRTCSTV